MPPEQRPAAAASSAATDPEEPSSGYVRYVLSLVFLVAIFNVCDRTIMSILVEEVKADLALDDRQIGLVMGLAFTVVHLGAAVPVGRLADRTSRRAVISAGLIIWSAMTIFAGLSRSYIQLFVARMGVGLGEAAGAPPSQSLISDYVPPHRRAAAISVLTTGGVAGLGMGMIIGGFANELWGWRYAFIIAGAPGILLGVLFFLTVREPPRGRFDDAAPGDQTPPPIGSVVGTLLRTPSYRYLILGACLAGMTTYGKNFWEPTFLRRVYELGPAEVGVLYFFIGPLPQALGAYFGGRLGDRLGRKDPRWYMWLSALANLLAAPFSLAFLLLPRELELLGVPVSFVCSALASVLLGVWSPQSGALGQALARPRMRAVSAALWSSLHSFVGLGLGPYLVGELNMRFEPSFGASGVRYSLAIATLSLALAALFQLLSARTLRHDLAGVRGKAAN
jgi:MFS family permease